MVAGDRSVAADMLALAVLPAHSAAEVVVSAAEAAAAGPSIPAAVEVLMGEAAVPTVVVDTAKT